MGLGRAWSMWVGCLCVSMMVLFTWKDWVPEIRCRDGRSTDLDPCTGRLDLGGRGGGRIVSLSKEVCAKLQWSISECIRSGSIIVRVLI